MHFIIKYLKLFRQKMKKKKLKRKYQFDPPNLFQYMKLTKKANNLSHINHAFRRTTKNKNKNKKLGDVNVTRFLKNNKRKLPSLAAQILFQSRLFLMLYNFSIQSLSLPVQLHR